MRCVYLNLYASQKHRALFFPVARHTHGFPESGPFDVVVCITVCVCVWRLITALAPAMERSQPVVAGVDYSRVRGVLPRARHVYAQSSGVVCVWGRVRGCAGLWEVGLSSL